jgi:hypothetical protein
MVMCVKSFCLVLTSSCERSVEKKYASGDQEAGRTERVCKR